MWNINKDASTQSKSYLQTQYNMVHELKLFTLESIKEQI